MTITPEVAERMAAFIREMADLPGSSTLGRKARAIEALLPKPVDPAVVQKERITREVLVAWRSSSAPYPGHLSVGFGGLIELIHLAYDAAYRAGQADGGGAV